MKATCAAVRSLAPLNDVASLSTRLEGHIGECLACQAEMARYGKLRRQLAALAGVVLPAPAHLVKAVEAAIGPGADAGETEVAQSHPAHVAAAAGAVVAAAAGAVAVVVWRHSKAVV